MEWEYILKISPSIRTAIKHGFENESVIDELSREPAPIQEENFIRKYHQQLKHEVQKFGIAIEKYEVGKIKGNTTKHINDMRDIIIEIESITYNLKGEIK